MGLFKAIVSTVINVATLPVDIVKDVVTMGGVLSDQQDKEGQSYTASKLERIKEEADD